MPWEFSNERPIYLQLMELFKLNIVSGVFQPGERLPSVRDLAAEASVNPNTMQKALSELEREELVFSQRTSGRFITEDKAMIERVRSDLAKTEVSEFIKRMEKLGFQKTEICSIMEDILKEGN
ncbi:MAG: GntR family transcriptional regulator [Bacillota bacterium]|nr:GntR family transcriptional regulator [Bacillota bacterium]